MEKLAGRNMQLQCTVQEGHLYFSDAAKTVQMELTAMKTKDEEGRMTVALRATPNVPTYHWDNFREGGSARANSSIRLLDLQISRPFRSAALPPSRSPGLLCLMRKWW
jgi:hypothetical protein